MIGIETACRCRRDEADEERGNRRRHGSHEQSPKSKLNLKPRRILPDWTESGMSAKAQRAYRVLRRRQTKIAPPNPVPASTSELGSGTDGTVSTPDIA